MKDINVLFTGCGAQYSPGQIGSLKSINERKIRIIGADIVYDSSVLSYVDALYKVSPFSADSYVDELIDICRKEQVNVLIPTMSGELVKLFDNRDRFRKIGTIVSVASKECVEIATDKYRLYEFMRMNGIDTPKYSLVRKVSDLEKSFDLIGYPKEAVCVKALNSSGSRGIRIVNPQISRFDILFNEKPNSFFISFDELKQILSERNEMPPMMAMEYLPGMEYSVDLLADHGKVMYIAGRETNVNNASIPQEATLSYNEEAYIIAEKVISALKLDGNADLDFKFDMDGHPVLMEVNPRVAATMQIFAKGGLNLVYLRIKQLLGEELPKADIQYGVKMRRRYQEMFS